MPSPQDHPMTTEDRIRQDLDYVTSTVRRERVGRGVPAVYFHWASIVPPGLALIDLLPQSAGLYWGVFGIGGGALKIGRAQVGTPVTNAQHVWRMMLEKKKEKQV